LERSIDKYGTNLAFTLKIAEGEYRDITYIRFFEECKSLAEGLIKFGLGGEKIAVIGKNSYNWFLANIAIQFAGGTAILIDKDMKEEDFESSLIRSRATAIFFDSKEEKMVREIINAGNTRLEKGFAMFDTEELPTLTELLEQGKRYRDEGGAEIEDFETDPDAVSMYFFTSGTTAQSKIVTLSQWNVVSNVYNMCDVEPFGMTDTTIALLPYHHLFGYTGQWVMLASGIKTVYCDGLKYIQKNLKEYGVSFFVGVPLVIEMMYKKIMKTAEKEGLDGRIRTFSKVARGLNKMHIDVRRRMFKSVLDALGGRLNFIILGGAAGDPECIQAFNDFGIFCIQGYGLSEASPVIVAERKGYQRLGSVGIPMKGCEVKIVDPDENGIGEVIARGDNIMKGYLDDEEGTAEAIRDGWLYTGDLGYFDKDGYLFLTGRKKNVIVLKNGENVSPEELEEYVNQLPYQLENIIVGIPDADDARMMTVTLKLVYDPEQFEGKTKEEIDAVVKADIEKINEKLPLYKRIKRVIVTDEPMIKTSTGKVRRFMEIEKIVEEDKAKAEAKAKAAEEAAKATEGSAQ
jgi:long-chain acyl-CoA synthetase